MQGIKDATITAGGKTVRVAVISGLGNAEPLVERVVAGEDVGYDLIEIMACPGGCIDGAGNPAPAKVGRAPPAHRSALRHRPGQQVPPFPGQPRHPAALRPTSTASRTPRRRTTCCTRPTSPTARKAAVPGHDADQTEPAQRRAVQPNDGGVPAPQPARAGGVTQYGQPVFVGRAREEVRGPAPGRLVQPRERFVEEEQSCTGRERPGHRHPTLHSTTEFTGTPVQAFAEPEPGPASPGPVRAGPGQAGWTAFCQAVSHGSSRSSWKTTATGRPSSPTIRPDCRHRQSREQPEQRRLATARRTEQADRARLRQVEGENRTAPDARGRSRTRPAQASALTLPSLAGAVPAASQVVARPAAQRRIPSRTRLSTTTVIVQANTCGVSR